MKTYHEKSLQDLLDSMLAVFSERDWGQFHSPKNLVMKLNVEVGELMEHFCWLTESQSFVKPSITLDEIQDEIADVFILLMHLSHTLGIDPVKAAHLKLEKIKEKYPVDKCKGLCHKYTEYE